MLSGLSNAEGPINNGQTIITENIVHTRHMTKIKTKHTNTTQRRKLKMRAICSSSITYVLAKDKLLLLLISLNVAYIVVTFWTPLQTNIQKT